MVEFRFADCREARLPSRSYGPYARNNWRAPKWATMYHRLKIEALYAFLADIYGCQGGLKGLNDKTSEGHRYNAHACGVYFTLGV